MADSDRKLEVLEDELKLLKGEVKKTLVDLRAFIMKEESPIHDRLDMGRPFRNGEEQPAGGMISIASSEPDGADRQRIAELEDQVRYLKNATPPTAATPQPSPVYPPPQGYPQAPAAPPWAGMPAGYVGAPIPPMPQAPVPFPVQTTPQQPVPRESRRPKDDPAGQYPDEPGPGPQASSPAIEKAPPPPAWDEQASWATSPEGNYGPGQAQSEAAPPTPLRRPSAQPVEARQGEPTEAPVEHASPGNDSRRREIYQREPVRPVASREPDPLGRESPQRQHQSNGHVSPQAGAAVAPRLEGLYPYEGTEGVVSLDVNLVASLVRWVSMAKSRMGQQGLMDLAELYTRACRPGPGLLKLVTHIGGMVGHGEPGIQKDPTFEVLDLLQQLHGILTGGSAIASIPLTGLEWAEPSDQIREALDAGG